MLKRRSTWLFLGSPGHSAQHWPHAPAGPGAGGAGGAPATAGWAACRVAVQQPLGRCHGAQQRGAPQQRRGRHRQRRRWVGAVGRGCIGRLAAARARACAACRACLHLQGRQGAAHPGLVQALCACKPERALTASPRACTGFLLREQVVKNTASKRRPPQSCPPVYVMKRYACSLLSRLAR